MEEETDELMKNVGNSCEAADYFSKLFLKPIEVRVGEDANGLEKITWNEGAPDKYIVQNLQHLEEQPQYTQEHINKQSIIGHLVSPPENNKNIIKLAICICAYSEDSSMLQRTLSGIMSNFECFHQAGISPQEIAVVFIFDGIENVHTTVETFFTNMDRQSKFLWKEYASTVEDMRNSNLFDLEDINVYSKQELDKLKNELLPAKKKQYKLKAQLIKKLQELKKKKGLFYSQLPEQVQEEYYQVARKQHAIQMGLDGDVLPDHKIDFYHRFFENKPQLREKCVMLAITQTEELCKRFLQARENTALLYTYRMKTKNMLNSYVFMCVKNKNQGKLSSQNWFFNGFCRSLKPNCTILLDIGLAPAPDALYRMYHYLEENPNCGGVCGYMALSLQKPQQVSMADFDIFTRAGRFFFDVQKAQQFEYHFSHMLDKPFEAAFGFIHVLPGAFSGYNMKKLFENNTILQEYFQSLNPKPKAIPVEDNQEQVSMFWRGLMPKCCCHNQTQAYKTLKQKNIYLAEDRILCLGIHQKDMTMAYLPQAEALVDSVTTLQKLLGQRKRWINGSYFAFEKVVDSWKCQDSTSFSIQMCFYVLMSYISYVSIALFLVALDMTLNTFTQQVIFPSLMNFFKVSTIKQLESHQLGIINAYGLGASFPVILDFIYVILVGSMIVLSLNLNQTNPRFQKTYYLVTSILGWYSILMYGVLISDLISQGSFMRSQTENGQVVSPRFLRILILIILGAHAIPPLIFLLIKRRFKYAWQIISSSLSYLFYAPGYLHVLMVFAYCRIDDVSWGTKGLTSVESHKMVEGWSVQKQVFIFRFIFTNVITATILMMMMAVPGPRSFIILVVSMIVALSLFFRLGCSIIYIIKHLCNYTRGQIVKKAASRVYSQKFQRVYQKIRPYLVKQIKKSYQSYIGQVVKSHIYPKGLKSSIMKNAHDHMRQTANRINKKLETQKLQKPRLLSPLPEEYTKKKGVLVRQPSIDSVHQQKSETDLMGLGKKVDSSKRREVDRSDASSSEGFLGQLGNKIKGDTPLKPTLPNSKQMVPKFKKKRQQ